MVHSTKAVLAILKVMVVWGIVIGVLIFAGMAPLFLGLFIALPVLGHATWHMYRKLLAA